MQKAARARKEEGPIAKKISTTDPESGWFHKGDQ